ncbi:protein kinase domain-containing protein [Okibacterium fritillariae]|uniref:protein kinase domain-containing protein n=1 Tax=Okibacterium fritillariae TaxID=123320 RepID=UPI00405550E5
MLLSGRWKLGELLGTGGSASVYAATDQAGTDQASTDQAGTDQASRTENGGAASPNPAPRVALKVLHPRLSADEALREAFFAEARATEGLSHPGVVSAIATGVHRSDDEERAWIAFPFREGRSLAETVNDDGPLTVPDALALAADLARATAAVHAAGLVHRDISPANVLVHRRADGTLDVSLIDFGLADAPGRPSTGSDVLRSSADPDAPHGVLGNAEYVSPEQSIAAPVDERGDVYQLSAVLFFALLGHAPYVRPTPERTMAAHREALPPVPSAENSRIPGEVDRVVVRGLAKHPDDRWQSAEAFAEALERIRVRRGWAGAPGAQSAQSARSAPGAADSSVTKRLPGSAAGLGGAVAGAAATTTAFRTPARPLDAPTAAAEPDDTGRPLWPWVAGLVVLATVTAIWVGAATGAPSSSEAGETPAPSATAAPAPAPSASTPAPLPSDLSAPAPAATATVPELAGVSLAAAERLLTAAGLLPGAISRQDSPLAADAVLSSGSPSGAAVPEGTAIDLVVASGSNAVPPVTGLTSQAAVQALQAAGFAVRLDSRAVTSPAQADIVLEASPGEGMRETTGSVIRLIVGHSVPGAGTQPGTQPGTSPTTPANPGTPKPANPPATTAPTSGAQAPPQSGGRG